MTGRNNYIEIALTQEGKVISDASSERNMSGKDYLKFLIRVKEKSDNEETPWQLA